MVRTGSQLTAVFQRFMPAAAAILGGALALIALQSPPPLNWVQLGKAALMVGGLTTGFAIGIRLLFKRLSSNANIQGRRSVVAGIAGPILLLGLSAVSSRWSTPSVIVLSVGTGVLAALGMFAPWLHQSEHEHSTVDLPVDDAEFLGAGTSGHAFAPVDDKQSIPTRGAT